jgi:hypothetical protein
VALTLPYQWEYAGLVIGDGTAYDIVVVRGVDDLPEFRTSDTERPSDHGLFPGRDLAGGRTIEIELEIGGASEAAFRANVNAFVTATVIRDTEAPLSFRLPSLGDRRINCRPRRRVVPVDVPYTLRNGAAVVQFVATDPRIYDNTETVLSTAAATSGGGRTYNRTYPLTYAAGGTGGNLTATNTGNFPTRPVLTITGPSTSPRVENVTAGKHLLFDLTLGVGDFLVVDLDARTILLGGTASRYSSLAAGSSWWDLAPGDNLLKFTSADSMGTLEVRYRSAWL